MKGTPRPVSLKTDTIKHRNRSKGDKKLKDGQPVKGKAKKAAANASRSSSMGPAASRMQRVHEIDEDVESSIDDPHARSGGIAPAYPGYPYQNGYSGPSQRPRHSFDGQYTSNNPHMYYGQSDHSSPHLSHSKSQEMAAALTLAGANQQHQAASAGSDPRQSQYQPPARSALNPSHQPYPNNIAAQVNSAFAARQAKEMAAFSYSSQRRQGQMQSAASSAVNSPLSSAAVSPVTVPAVPPHSLPQPQASAISASRQQPPSLPAEQRSERPKAWSPTLQPVGQPPLPGSNTPQRSPLNTSYPQSDSIQQNTANMGLPPSVNIDGLSSQGKPGQAGVMRHPSFAADVDRQRQKARLEQLFAEADQRLADGTSRFVPNAASTSGSASQSGRASAQNHHSASYKPYDRSLSRSSSRPGRINREQRHATTAATARQVVPRTTRPGSSASSSGDSSDPKRTIGGLTSPAHSLQSPRLAGIPDAEHDGMAIDGKVEDVHVTHADPSPPFGVPASSLGLHAPPSSERRGRSTTRKLRDGEYNDSVAYEMGALRMRDASRASSYSASRSQSPAQLPKLSSQLGEYMPQSRDSSGGGATIRTGDLEDGIVRNTATHRPVSDLRASHSPASGQTLPSLSEALSSASSRSTSGPRSLSRQSLARRALGAGSEHNGQSLPPLVAGAEELARLRTRCQELEFINGLMENRVAELEHRLASHASDCACRCTERGTQTSVGTTGLHTTSNQA